MVVGLLEFLQNVFGISPHIAVLFEIGIVIVIAAFFAVLAGALKQPLIPAYILAGMIIGPIGFKIIRDSTFITALSEIGIAFLLFVAGLEMSFKKLREVGKVVGGSGILQVATISALSFFVALLFGFLRIEAIYFAIAIPFSSTALVVKLLADKHKLDTLHARIAIGMLLVQDIIAIIALMVLASGSFSFTPIVASISKGVLLALVAVLLSVTVLNPILRFAAKSPELLSLVAIAFCFSFALASYLLGFSIIIGAFIAGLALANSPFKTEIEGRVRPLEAFFVIIFFVTIGMQFLPSGFGKLILPILAFILIVLVGEPVVSMIYVRIFGYTKRTSFLSGLFQAQTSEFSLIVVALGLSLGHISQEIFSMVVLITIITMSLTPYLIKYEYSFYTKFSRFLKFLERLPEKEKLEYVSKKKKDIALFGCHRMGTIFLKAFSHVIHRVVVIDINPNVIKSLMKRKISCIYGDIINPVIFDKINLKGLRLVVSTVPEKLDNLFLIEKVKRVNRNALIFVTADYISDALELYKKGADYVILPQVIGGERGLSFLKRIIKEKKHAIKAKEDHIKYLEDLRSFL